MDTGQDRPHGSEDGRPERHTSIAPGAPTRLMPDRRARLVEGAACELQVAIAGRRRPLGTAPAGALLPPLPRLDDGVEILISALGEARLSVLDRVAETPAPTIELADKLLQAIAGWFAEAATPGDVDFVTHPGTRELAAGAKLAAPTRPFWIEPTQRGGIEVMAPADNVVAPLICPVVGAIRVQTAAATGVTLSTSEILAAEGRLLQALTGVLHRLAALDEAATRAVDQRLIGRLERGSAEAAGKVSRVLTRLDEIGHSETATVARRVSELGAAGGAVALVLADLDIEADRSRLRAHRHDFEAVPMAALALGTRTRLVRLERGWWKSDLGPMVGAVAATEDEEQRPDGRTAVALLRRGGSYVIHDTASGRQERLSAHNEDRLAPEAFAIFPPLPKTIGKIGTVARFLWPLIRQDLPRIIGLALMTTLLGLLVPLATGLVFDMVIPGREVGMLWQLGLALGSAALLGYVFQALQQYAVMRIQGRTATVFRGGLWARLLSLPTGFFKRYSSGDLGQRLSGADTLRRVAIDIVFSATLTAVFSLFYLGLLLVYDTRLALLAVVLVLALAGLTLATGLLQIRLHRHHAEVSGWLSGFVFQLLQGIAKIRVAGAESRAFARWADRYADERRTLIKLRSIGNHFGALADSLQIITLAILFAAVIGLADTRFSPGLLMAFLAAYGAFQSAFLGLGDAVLGLFEVAPDLERARPILEAEPEIRPSSQDPGLLGGRIEIANVSFGYGEGVQPLFRGLSFAVGSGEHVAIVGPSGSGKSTLLRLLLGFEQPQSGAVLYDGQDLAGLDVAAVRRQIGVVLQHSRLFAGSILENVRGATMATHEDCEAAIEAAGFAEDLLQFPMGLHTPLTEGAAAISGGQRQRILIARALAGRPRMLFLDEATSALDNRTQAIVTASLERLEVTRLVIAHRLSTVRQADRIVVLDQGRIVEEGPFEALIAKGGLFAELARRQLV